MERVPYGAWPSPLSPEVLAAARTSITGLEVASDGSWWWSESRPADGGRQVVVRLAPTGEVEEASPPGVSVRSRVHGYGGAAFVVAGPALLYVALEDQAVWSVGSGSAPVRLSPGAPPGEAHCYADVRPV
ncbi:MAG: hypothetical protein ACYDD6_10285, partial [Acidimicrobiales bacterium]